MANIGFIGLGHMGSPMVKNLLKQQHQVTVFDVRPEAMPPLMTEGATPASTVAELAKNSEVVFTMLQTGEQVREVCVGKEGIFAHMHPGALYIDSSSIDIATSRCLHIEAKKHQIVMLDAPVSGGVKGAEAGTLTIMVGGEAAAFSRAQSLLAAVGAVVVHAGPAGNGQAAKICNNMILGISMIAVSEAFLLGEKLGLDPQQFFAISSHASGQCWAMTSYCPVPHIIDNVPANNEYKPGFTAQMMLKDLHLSQDAARLVGFPTELGVKATALYEEFVAQGNAEVDFSGIIRYLAQFQPTDPEKS